MLEAAHLSKEFPTAAGALSILRDVSLRCGRGESISIVGPSGSGKSTLLYILGGLEPPTSGVYTLGGDNPYELDDQQVAAFRNQKVGFVFQDHCLLPQCSVLENVLTPTLVAEPGDHIARAKNLLDRVGLADRVEHLPAELSGGEKQRVALARALILDPVLLLCDEPTGSLDRDSAKSVVDLLFEMHKTSNTILMMVTHNTELAARCGRRYELQDRNLVDIHIDAQVDAQAKP